jgi:hypothetical protein
MCGYCQHESEKIDMLPSGGGMCVYLGSTHMPSVINQYRAGAEAEFFFGLSIVSYLYLLFSASFACLTLPGFQFIFPVTELL